MSLYMHRAGMLALAAASVLVPTYAFSGILGSDPMGFSTMPGVGMILDTLVLPVHQLTLTRCEGGDVVVEIEAEIDVLNDDLVTLESGEFCGMELELFGPVVMVAHDNDSVVTANLPAGAITVQMEPITVVPGASGHFSVQIADSGWLSWPWPAGNTTVGPGHPWRAPILASIRDESTLLFID